MEKSKIYALINQHKNRYFIIDGAYCGCGEWVMLQEDEALVTLNVRKGYPARYCDDLYCNQCFSDHVALYRVTKDSLVELESKPRDFCGQINPALLPILDWYKAYTLKRRPTL